jgi:hypothetical protein
MPSQAVPATAPARGGCSGRLLFCSAFALTFAALGIAAVTVFWYGRTFGWRWPSELIAAGGGTWRGRTSDGWDFTLSAPRPGEDAETTVFDYRASALEGAEESTGRLEVTRRGGRLLAVLRGADGGLVRGMDGYTTPDGRLAFGTAWRRADAGPASEDLLRWWATIEAPVPLASSPLDLNRATVGELEAAGLSPRAARSVVQGALWAPFSSVAEAMEAPGLTAGEQAVLRGATVVP